MNDKSSDLSDGLEKHVWPASNGHGIVSKDSSDAIFGEEGLGLYNTVWMSLLSFLARTGIQEQTGSKKGETDVESCKKGWGQGAYSSRVFDVAKGVNERHLDEFLEHLSNIANELKIQNGRITERVLGSFIATQIAEPYSTINGTMSVKTRREKLAGVFRGHVQWQGLITLCGQVDRNGIVHLSPELIRMFFKNENPFFSLIIDHRRKLREGILELGESTEIFSDIPEYICLLYTSPSPRDRTRSRMPSSA